jgi:uncharacterized protein YkwD
MSSRRRPPAVLALALAALALAAPAGASAAECPGVDVTPTDQGAPAAGQATLCLLNGERAAAGLSPLSENARLTGASQAYTDLMLAKSFFAHVTPDGVDVVTRLTDAGYLTDDLDGWAAGENLAWAQGVLATPRAIVKAWMESPGHRENILSREYAEIGIGVALGTPIAGPSGATYTTDFGQRESSAPGATAQARATTPRSKQKAAARKAAARKAAARKARRAARARARRAHRARAARSSRAVYRAQFISG